MKYVTSTLNKKMQPQRNETAKVDILAKRRDREKIVLCIKVISQCTKQQTNWVTDLNLKSFGKIKDL